MGNDLARMGGDSFTAETGRQNCKPMRHVENIEIKKLLTTKNRDVILEEFRKWNHKKIGIDSGSGTMGVSVFDMCREIPELKNKMVSMNNRTVSMEKFKDREKTQRIYKEDLHDNLRSMLTNGELLLLDDESVKHSLRSVQMELVQDSHGTTKVKIIGNDTHIAEGLTRMAELMKKEKFKEFHIYWA